jgi:predicted transcriptional regulator
MSTLNLQPFEYERQNQILLHVRQPTEARLNRYRRRSTYQGKRSQEDFFMRILVYLEKHGNLPDRTLHNAIETTLPIAQRYLTEMVHFGLVREVVAGSRMYKGQRRLQMAYAITRKGRKYLRKMRELWNLIDGSESKQEPQIESV